MWVGQAEPKGCVCASFAMILGISYEEAKARFPYGPSEEGYYASTTVHQILRQDGWKIEYRTERKPGSGGWPPLPFAPVHMATVLVSQSAPCWHSVVMRHDGVVLDPITQEARVISNYVEVQSVVGLAPPPCTKP